MSESDSNFFDKPLLRKTPKKNVDTKPSETEHHTFTKPELRSIDKIKTSDGRSDQDGHTFEKPALRGTPPKTVKNEEVPTGKFDKPALRSVPGSLASPEKERTYCAKSGFEKPALMTVEWPENKGMDLEKNDPVEGGEENQKPCWMINLRKTGNLPLEDNEKPKSSEPEWSQAARNKAAKALEIIQSKENQSQEAEKPATPWVESNMLRKIPKSYHHQETNANEGNRPTSQTGQKGFLSYSSSKDLEIVGGERSRSPATGTGEKKKNRKPKILRTYPNNKVLVLLQHTTCDADVVITPGVSTSSSGGEDVVGILSVPLWNRGERKEKHKLYEEIKKVLMGLSRKSWKSAGFCINPVGGWNFEHYFKCFLYEINNFYTGLSVKYSVECIFLFTNDGNLYKVASHIAENYFQDASEEWSPTEGYKHLGTWHDDWKGHPKSTDLYLQTGHERTSWDLSLHAPSPFCAADSRPIPARIQGVIRTTSPYRSASVESPSFLRGWERGHRESSRHTRSLSVPDENRFSSERVQQESMTQPSQISLEHPIQETASLENEFPHYKMNARPRGICLIISNLEFKKEDLSTRHGTEIDLVKLKDIFTRLYFIVMVRENLDGSDMIRELVDISRCDHTQYDCFVCCILSHGTQDRVYGSDGIPVEIGRLTSMVQPIMCRTLGEKPKLFFIQACQGLQKEEGIEIEVDAGVYKESIPLIPNNADFLLGYSTVRGYVSFRLPDEGAWYISKLVDMLDKYHKCMDLLSILTKVNDEVSKMEVVIDGMRLKQMPSKWSTLRRKLVFK